MQQIWRAFRTAQTRMLSSAAGSTADPTGELIQTLRSCEKKWDDSRYIERLTTYIEQGADPQTQSPFGGKTTLDIAALKDTPAHRRLLAASIQAVANSPKSYYKIIGPFYLPCDSSGKNALHHAAENNNLYAIQQLTNPEFYTAETRDCDGNLPLHFAMDYDTANAFLKQPTRRQKINGTNGRHDTPFTNVVNLFTHYRILEHKVRSKQILKTARLFLEHGADPNHESGTSPINPCPLDKTMIHNSTPFAEVFAHFAISFFPHSSYDSSPTRPIFWRMMKLLREFGAHPIIKRAIPYGPFAVHPSISREVLTAKIGAEIVGTREAMVDEVMTILQAPPLQTDTFLQSVEEHLKPENKEEFQEAIEFFRSWQEEWQEKNVENTSDRVCSA